MYFKKKTKNLRNKNQKDKMKPETHMFKKRQLKVYDTNTMYGKNHYNIVK